MGRDVDSRDVPKIRLELLHPLLILFLLRVGKFHD